MTEKLLNYFSGDELAANVWLNKYAQEGDETPDDMHKRMAKEFARIENKYIEKEKQIQKNYQEGFYSYDKGEGLGFDPLTGISILSWYGEIRKDLDEETIYNLFKDFKYIIPQGSVMSQLGAKSIGSLSNCFVIGQPEDSYGGIFRKDEEMAQLMKRRGGVGIDISTLRPEGTPTSNAAKSSTGAVSFMHRFSNTTREVAQNGRRGAAVISIDIKHPDVMEFIKIKRDLSQVTGANISIKLNDEFMKAVESDEDYALRFPCDISFPIDEIDITKSEYNKLETWSNCRVKKIKAKEYWDEIIKSAHNVAEPGLMFWDTMVNYSPDGVYEQFKQVTTNPCFRGDMRILTPTGYKTFKELNNQETEFINKDGEIVQGTVWCNGTKSIYKLTTWNNNYIYCTEDHVFLTTDNKEVEAKSLIGKRLMPYFTINEEINEYVKLGFLQGDSNLIELRSNSYLGLKINIKEKDREIAELFEIQNNNLSIYIQGYNELLKQLKFNDNPLPERDLPKTFDTWSIKNKLMFFKGMYSANGSIITNQRIAYKTTCKTLSEQIKMFLHYVGINSYITTNKEKLTTFCNEEYFCEESYDINISDFESIKIFAEKIGFVHSYKKNSLINLILEKAPKIRSFTYDSTDLVYDFNLQDNTHWGIVENVIAHNCAEIGMQPYDACRLIAVNLYNFVENPFTEEAKFNFEKLYIINYEAMRLSDDLIDLEIEHIDRILTKLESDTESETIKWTEIDLWNKIKETAQASRRTGLGFTALGDTLAALGLKYDSEEALNTIEKIMGWKLKSELDCTTDLAIFRGTFDGWNNNLEFTDSKIREDLFENKGNNSFYSFINTNFVLESKRMQKYGRRNLSWSSVAPTGSVSILAACTSGIEPLFMGYYMRRKKVNPNDKDAKVDFTDQNGDTWQEFPVLHPKFKEWIKTTSDFKGQVEANIITKIEDFNNATLKSLFEQSPWYGSTANDINWIKRVQIQSIIQKYITHSISSTINLPNNVTEEEVSKIYLESWKQGLKGITVYRDGSRSGVLVSSENKNRNTFDYIDAVKRPKELEGEVHQITIKNVTYKVIIGLLNNKPYEIFLDSSINKINGKGIILKKSKGNYFFKGDNTTIDITSHMNEQEAAITRLISTSLRHGADIKFIVEQLNKCNGDLFSFTKGLARVLKKYIPNGAKSTVKCSECGSSNVIFEEGCNKCLDCGASTCS